MRTRTIWAPTGWGSTCASLGTACSYGLSRGSRAVLLLGFQPNDPEFALPAQKVAAGREQVGNKKQLTNSLSVYTRKRAMGRPPKPEHLRRSKLFPLRLKPGEMAELEEASRRLREPVAEILRKGATLYIRQRGKGGSRIGKEKNR